MCLHPLRGAVVAPQQREDVVDLLGVLLRLGTRQVQQPLLERDPRMTQQVREGEPGRDAQPVRGVPLERRDLRSPLLRTAGRAAQAEVEAAGVQCVDEPELLDRGQSGAVPELDGA